jgi:mannan endo-1,4-beta-mannosidase
MRTLAVRSLGLLVAIGCSSDGDPNEPAPGGTGGATGGSNSASGGVTAKGGTTGGTATAGGVTSPGGTPATNGGVAASGGSIATGGVATAGGAASTGGASGGASNGQGGSGGSITPAGGKSGGGAPSATGGGGSGGGSSTCGATGFHVKDGALYDVNCAEFVMRGVNYPYAWFSTRSAQQDLQAIAATGANAVRLVLATGARWTKTSESTLTSLIGWAKAAKLVSIVEVHDTTGYSEQAESVPLSNATAYWMGSDIVSALKGQEAFVILNIGNEPNGNNTSTDWARSHATAVEALRGSAGFNHTLMVDAPNWGQDWENRMRDGGGSSIWEADPQKNLMFSVHMYDVYGSSATVTSYFNNFLMNYEAPLVVGEFAADHGSSGNVDEDTILSLAESLSVGYLGWSWSGNGAGLETLDITTNFDSGTLTTWGTRLIRGMNGIEATSETCTCFD